MKKEHWTHIPLKPLSVNMRMGDQYNDNYGIE